MPKVNIVRPFTLRRQDGTEQAFRMGVHDVTEEDADHWYLQAHTDEPPEGELPPPLEDRGEPTEVEVVKPFTLMRDDGTSVYYRKGIYEMPQQDAEHWYTQHHLKDPPEPRYPAGTPQYAEQMMRQENQRRLREMAMQQASHQAGEKARDEVRGQQESEDEKQRDRPRTRKQRQKDEHEATGEVNVEQTHADKRAEREDLTSTNVPESGNFGFVAPEPESEPKEGEADGEEDASAGSGSKRGRKKTDG